MPIGNAGTNTAKSLRSLTATATVTHFFDKDKELLAKVYRQGILPVKVINEIYCQWARDAIAQSKVKVKSAYDDYVKAWSEMRITRYQLTAALFSHEPDESRTERLRNVLAEKKAESQAKLEIFAATTEELSEIDEIFGALERSDIMRASRNWGMIKIRRVIEDRVVENQQLARTIRFLAAKQPNIN